MRLEAQDGENDEGRVDGGEGVAHRDQDHVTDDVVLGGVVGAEGDQGAECQPERVEDLRGRLAPHIRVQQFFQLQTYVHQYGPNF